MVKALPENFLVNREIRLESNRTKEAVELDVMHCEIPDT